MYLISLSYYILDIVPSHISYMEQMLMYVISIRLIQILNIAIEYILSRRASSV